MLYGVLQKDIIIVLANGVGLALLAALMYLKLRQLPPNAPAGSGNETYSSEKARGPHWLFGVGPAGSREKLRPYLVRLDVEGPVLATALGKIPIQVVATPLRDFGVRAAARFPTQ